MHIIDDFYDDGRFLRRWSFEDGKAVCLENALEVALATPSDIKQVLAENDQVRQLIADYTPTENDGEA